VVKYYLVFHSDPRSQVPRTQLREEVSQRYSKRIMSIVSAREEYVNKEENMRTKIAVALAVIVVCLELVVSPAFAAGQKKPNILIIWGGRHRHLQYQRLQSGMMGYRRRHRQHRQEWRAVHRLVRPAELHGRARGVHHRAVAHPAPA